MTAARTISPGRAAAWVGLAACLALLIAGLSHHNELVAVVGGVGSGAFYAAIALGVVLTYRGAGVVNFANAATAMFVAYIYADLRSTGYVFLPPLPNPLAPIEGIVHRAGANGFSVPDWPTRVGSGHPLSLWPAIIVSLLACVVLGLIFHFLIFRPLRDAPPLAKVVASVGLFIIMQGIVVLRFGGIERTIRPIVRKRPVHLPDHLLISRDQLVLAVIVVIVTAVLWAVFRFTRFGLATRAAAENEKGAVLLGFSPDMLAGVNWVLSTLLAGMFGILTASINGFTDPITVTLLIVPALAAALLANFTSFWVTTAAAFGLAMAQSWISFLSTRHWFPHAGGGAVPGVREALPFLVIIVVLFTRGQSLPTRGALTSGRLPFAPHPTNVALRASLASAVCLAGLFLMSSDWRQAITLTLVSILICLSLVILTGFVGQISLAQMTLAGVSGFTLAKVATNWHVPFPIGPLIGAAVATLFGLATAIPALRVRGVNLAVVTFAFAVTIENLVFRNPSFNNPIKPSVVNPPRLFGLKFGPLDPTKFDNGKIPNPWFGVFCLVVVVLLSLVVVNVRRSVTGRQMLAVRSNERAAAAAGIGVAGTKMLAFGLAAFIAGLGGALSGYDLGSVTPLAFGSIASLTIFAFAYLGGISSVTGAVLGGCIVAGGVFFTALHHWFNIGPAYTLVLGGLGLILTAIRNPEGIAGALSITGRQLQHLARKRRRPAPVPPPTALPPMVVET